MLTYIMFTSVFRLRLPAALLNAGTAAAEASAAAAASGPSETHVPTKCFKYKKRHGDPDLIVLGKFLIVVLYRCIYCPAAYGSCNQGRGKTFQDTN